MKVLSLGTDEHVFEKGSAVRQRQMAYADALGQLDVVVLTRRPHATEQDRALLLRAVAGNPIVRLFRAYTALRASSRPDVVTAQDPFEVGLICYFAATHFNVPLHVQVHTDFHSPEFLRHSPLNRTRVLIASFVLKRATRVRVVSERAKSALQGIAAPVTVLPIFVDVAKFRTAEAPQELRERFSKYPTKLLVVARLEPEKNVELALHVFAQIASNDACLIIVGKGREWSKLRALARTLRMEERVFFEGEKNAAEYYPLADLVLVPSKYEGYGLVIVEALAAGKPVLSTDVGVAREAGATVSNETNFVADLKQWFVNGPRTGQLKAYPYNNFDDYVRAYRADMEACTNAK